MPSEERTWAMLAHLSVLLNLVTGLLGLVGALVIYLGGIQCSQGQDFRYWLVGDWVRGTLTGQ
nr:DUF4870 domain-containing protein [Anaerolineae bacterium]